MAESVTHNAFCIHCGAKLPQIAKFCPLCGQPIQTGAKVKVAAEEEIIEPSASPLPPMIPITSDNADRIVQLDIQGGYTHYPKVAYTSDGTYLIVMSGHNAWLWSVRQEAIPEHSPTVKYARPNSHGILSIQDAQPFMIQAVALTQQGFLVVGASTEAIRTWDLSSGQTLYTLGIKHATGLSVSSDGKYMAVTTRTNAIPLYRVTDATLVRVMQSKSQLAGPVAFSPDSQVLAAWTPGWNDHLSFWRVSDGVLLNTIKDATGTLKPVAFAPDGNRLAVCARDINIFNLANGYRLERIINVPKGVTRGLTIAWSLTFSPDGRVLASGHECGDVCLWDVVSGKLLNVLKGHEGGKTVMSIAFAPAGHVLASGSSDHTVRFWGLR